jgi:TonB family protein
VYGEWVPRITEGANRNDPNGCLFSRVDRKTVLQFRVDRAGKILGVRIETSSGVPYIDQTALDAMTSLGRVSRTPPASFFGQSDEAALGFAFTLVAWCPPLAGNRVP